MSRRLFWGVLAAALAAPGVAAADPVATFIVVTLAQAGASITTALAVAHFVAFVALPNLALAVLTRLTMGARGSQSAAERQASVVTLQLGEGPREAIFGLAATSGQLIDAYNSQGQYGTDWESLCIALADHRCHSLVGYYINDVYYEFTGPGPQPGFNGQLEIYFFDGRPDQVADAGSIANTGGRWTASDRLAGVCWVRASYKADAPNAQNPVWPQGRPQFLWVVKGAFLYDPRKDSTVPGGSGAHRWENPATWEWSDNAYLARYAYTRGIYAQGQVADPTQLLVGRGLSADQAPPERVFAPANLCDELVPLKAGGTERRYRVNGVVRADEPAIRVEEMFAAAMGGVIIQPDGGVEIEPGAAKAVVATITDADLPIGLPVRVDPFLSAADRVNTVTPRYVAPDQLWRDHAAPVRRSIADIEADGSPCERTLSLPLVTSQTQAQRVAEIERRLARKERRAAIWLGPRFAYLEDGDWIAWQSDRRFGGSTVVFRIEAAALNEKYQSQLVLREIGTDCYAWNAAVDEGVPGAAPVDEPGAVAPLALADVAFASFDLVGGDGSSQPAIKAVWAAPVDAAIKAVRIEVRKAGESEIAFDRCDDPNLGELVTTNGVMSATGMEARLLPVTLEGRRITASAWVPVTTGALDVPGGQPPSPNLWRKQDYVPSGGASSIDPAFGVSNWGFRFPQTAGAVTVSGKVFATKPAGVYSVGLRVKLTGGTGTATLRVGWRDAANNPIADLPDRTITVGTTEERWTWDLLGSTDPDFVNAKFLIFTQAGDVAAGKQIDVADVIVVVGGKAPAGFAPSPDDPEGLRLVGYTGDLNATVNKVFRQQTAPTAVSTGDFWVVLDGGGNAIALRQWNGSAWINPADVTSLNTAAAIVGQGALATLSQADWATRVTGSGKPEDFATRSRVFRQTSAPSSPNLNDIWTQLDGVGNAIAMWVWNGSVWLNGADRTVYNTAASITGQGAWATASVPAGLTPTIVNGRTQYIGSDGQIFDYRGLYWGYSVDGVAGRAVDPLTSTSSTVSMAAHTVRLYRSGNSGGFPISVPAASFSGLSADQPYTVFYRPQFGDSHCPHSNDAYAFIASSDGYMLIGAVRTATGAGTYVPPGESTPVPSSTWNGSYQRYNCVAADSYLASGQRAGDAAIGDPLTLMSPAGDRILAGVVEAVLPGEADCLTFRTALGAVLTVSDTTPIMTRRGPGFIPSAVKAAEATVGLAVPVLSAGGELVWDVVEEIAPAGRRPVALITAKGVGVYAAADSPDGPKLFTHNAYNKVLQ